MRRWKMSWLALAAVLALTVAGCDQTNDVPELTSPQPTIPTIPTDGGEMSPEASPSP